MYLSKIIECNSLLETLYFIKEDLLRGETFPTILIDHISTAEDLKSFLDNKYILLTNTKGIGYALLRNLYYKDFLFVEMRSLNSKEQFQYIIDNANKIDKLYKLKYFI